MSKYPVENRIQTGCGFALYFFIVFIVLMLIVAGLWLVDYMARLNEALVVFSQWI